MKTQIVYTVISTEKDLFLEELWASVFSLRHYHPEATVNVIADAETAKRIEGIQELQSMITNVIVGYTPESYTPKEKSRELKTTIREIISGDFLYIDTDTVICDKLDEIDKCCYDVAAVPDSNIRLKDNPFASGMINSVKRIYDKDVSSCANLFNGGVIYAKDSEVAHEFFRKWNKNWSYSCFKKECSQDQPALWASNMEMGDIMGCLPHTFNSQVAMSLQYFAEANIVHFLHMPFIPDQSYSPFLSQQLYREIKKAGAITPEIEHQIIHCKCAFTSPSMPVGKDQMLFLFTEAGKAFVQIYKEGGPVSTVMLKLAKWLWKLHSKTR